MYVASEPGIHLHVQRGFNISVSAVGKAADKEINRNGLSCRLINDLHGRTAPVHLTAFAGLAIQMVGDIMCLAVSGVILAELCFAHRDRAMFAASVAVLFPEHHQGYSDTLQLLVYRRIIRKLVNVFRQLSVRKEQLVNFRVIPVSDVLISDVLFLCCREHLADGALRHVS